MYTIVYRMSIRFSGRQDTLVLERRKRSGNRYLIGVETWGHTHNYEPLYSCLTRIHTNATAETVARQSTGMVIDANMYI